MFKKKNVHDSLKNRLTSKSMHDKMVAHIFGDDEEETALNGAPCTGQSVSRPVSLRYRGEGITT